MAALGLLAKGPASGYDLLKIFDRSMVNVWSATQGQLYAELNKLANDGLIEVAEVGQRGRKEYIITAAGRSALQAWLGSLVDDPPLRDAGLLRVFLLGEVDDHQAREFLERAARRAQESLDSLRVLQNSTEWTNGDSMFFGRVALEHGLRRYAMEVEWAQWALLELDDRRADRAAR
jgi:DNA-binding PadR family transcriptional regulator